MGFNQKTELYTHKEVCSEIEFPTEFATKSIVFWDMIPCNFAIKVSCPPV